MPQEALNTVRDVDHRESNKCAPDLVVKVLSVEQLNKCLLGSAVMRCTPYTIGRFSPMCQDMSICLLSLWKLQPRAGACKHVELSRTSPNEGKLAARLAKLVSFDDDDAVRMGLGVKAFRCSVRTAA